MKFYLEELPYSYDALQPFMDKETVEIHYSKHHKAYVDNLNKLVENLNFNYSLEELLKNLENLPKEIVTGVKNNGGGHYNHTLFWKILTPEKQEISKEFLNEINKTFGSFENFKNQFEEAGKKHFGSGWVWLIKTNEGLKIVTTPNQDTPFNLGKPILAVDVWEHAYYLKYQNRRADYLSNIWNIINWQYVEKLYKE